MIQKKNVFRRILLTEKSRRSRFQGFPRTVGRQPVEVAKLNPLAVWDNDFFIAQARKASRDIDSRGGKDFCYIFLGQVNVRTAPFGTVL